MTLTNKRFDIELVEQENLDVEVALGRSFLFNPIIKLLMGRNPSVKQLMRFNRWMVRQRGVHQMVVRVSGEVAGILKYADYPQCTPRSYPLAALWDIVVATKWRAPLAILVSMTDKDPTWHHRHLIVLGVVPEFQRQGVGSALLEKFLEDADRDQITAVLETDTEDAVRLYSKFGFTVLKEMSFRKYRFWRMHREYVKKVEGDQDAL